MHRDTTIFHVDVNSAFLSWETLYLMKSGGSDAVDLREIPAAVGGDESQRHGIVLAKSTSAKAFGIRTGEPLAKARQKCPELVVVRPHYEQYVACSQALMQLLRRYSPQVEQFSIDEAFCDMSGTENVYGSLVDFAHQLKDEIYETLGFTVNIGISVNKLLAKMASDFKKPNLVHTLFPEEIPLKLWPLPVEELFYVGRSTASQLHNLGIHTIGDLAHFDPEILKYHLKKHGETIYRFANGIDTGEIDSKEVANKGYGNSITLGFDVTDADTAKHILLSLCETVGARIRADHAYVSVVSVSVVDTEFHHSSRQCTLPSSTNVTELIYTTAVQLFDALWDFSPLRLLGVSTSHASNEQYNQYNLFDLEHFDRLEKLNLAVDSIRQRFGEDAIKRASFLSSQQPHMTEGLNRSKRKQPPHKN